MAVVSLQCIHDANDNDCSVHSARDRSTQISLSRALSQRQLTDISDCIALAVRPRVPLSVRLAVFFRVSLAAAAAGVSDTVHLSSSWRQLRAAATSQTVVNHASIALIGRLRRITGACLAYAEVQNGKTLWC